MRKPTVLVADDHVILTQGLVRLLSDDFDVVGTVRDGADLVEVAQRLRPDVIVADVDMPGMSGIDALVRLKKRGISSRMVMLTMHGEPALAAGAVRAGASGFLLKDSAGEELVQAIHKVLDGELYLTPAVTRGVLDQLANSSHDRRQELTPRQRDVLRLIAEGRRTKEIADLLELSTRTVETHKYEIMQRIGAHSTAELVRYALDNGMG